MQTSKTLIINQFLLLAALVLSHNAMASNCLYVSSYHKGYEWNDGIERGLEKTLGNTCKLDKFYMDTKRQQDTVHGKKQGIAAREHILNTQPDVIIACDDNASRYLVKPYFRNSKLPFVFCGINWTVEQYGYPYTNVTGMIEVAPIEQTLKTIRDIVISVRSGVYLSSDVFTEHKDFSHYKQFFTDNRVQVPGVFVKTFEEWKQAFLLAQTADFVLLGNNAGINDWDENAAREFVLKNSKTLTVTNYDWMMPYSMFAMTKIPEEQGEWAGQVALSVLSGENINNIPVVINRRWNMYVNPDLLKTTNISIPSSIMQKAIRVGQE